VYFAGGLGLVALESDESKILVMGLRSWHDYAMKALWKCDGKEEVIEPIRRDDTKSWP
jgi:hypothetical protein